MKDPDPSSSAPLPGDPAEETAASTSDTVFDDGQAESARASDRFYSADDTHVSDPVPPPLPDDGLSDPEFEEQEDTIQEGDASPRRRPRMAVPEDQPQSYEELHDAITERMPRPTGQAAPVRTYVRNFIQQHWGGKDEHRGKLIGDYEIIEEIGRGSMGAVFKARQISLNREVALKMILSGQFATKANRIRFRREAEVSAELRHPNIVAIHDFGDFEGQPYYTMDYVEGRDLAAMVSDRPLPWQHAAYYIHKVAHAVAYAHERGIIHRDLKPQNILVDQFDEPRILDFGLARRMDLDSAVTMSTSVIGSPSYMPPEQALGQHNLVGPQSDVYGLGAILYELLTIRPPILAPTIAKTLEMVVNFEPIPPNRANPSIPDDLNTVVLKCLEKTLDRRYQSAMELADELGRVLEDRPILAKPTGILEHGYRWCRRNRAVAALIALSAALLIGSSVVSTSLWVQAELSLKKAEEERQRAEAASLAAEVSRKEALQAQAHAVSEMEKARAALEQVRAAEALAAREGQRAQTAEAGQQALEERLREESVRAETALREAEAFRQRAGLTDISQDLLMAMDLTDRGLPGEALAHLAQEIRRSPQEWLAPALTLNLLSQNTWARPLTPPLPHEGQGQVLGAILAGEDQRLITWTDQFWINFWTADAASIQQKEDLGAGILDVRAAADGTWALAALQGGELRRVERSTAHSIIVAQNLWLDTASGRPGDFAIQPGGERVAYVTDSGAASVVDPVTGKAVYELPGFEPADGAAVAQPATLAYHPDGSRLLIARGETAFLVDTATGSRVGAALKLGGPAAKVGFSADGSRFFVMLAGEPRTQVEIRLSATGQVFGPGLKTTQGIERLALDASGALAFLLQEDGTVSSWHTGMGLPLGGRRQANAEKPVVAMGAAGYALVTKSQGLRMTDPLRPGNAVYFPIIEREAARIWLSDAGDRLISIQPGQGVVVYDTSPSQALPELFPHGQDVAEAVFSENGGYLLSLGADGSAQYWETSTGKLLNSLAAPSGAKVTVSAIDPPGKVVVLGLDNGRVLVWDAAGSGQTRDLLESGPAITAVHFSLDGKLLAAATAGLARHVWLAGERTELAEPAASTLPLRVGLGPGGQQGEGMGGPGGGPPGPGGDGPPGPMGGGRPGMRPGGRAPTLDHRISMLSPELQSRRNYTANDLLFSQDGKYLATIAPLCVFVYSLETKEVLDFRFAITPEVGGTNFLETVATAAGESFSGELEKRMFRFYGEHPQDMRVWSMVEARPVTQPLDMDFVPSLNGFSRNSELLFTAAKSTVRLWNAGSGKPRTRTMTLDAEITHAAFDREGARLLAVTKGGRVHVIDTRYGFPLGNPLVCPETVNYAEFSPDGHQVLTAGADGYVRLFDTPLPREPAPEWLAQLAESAAGVQVDDRGRMTRLENLAAIRRQAQEAVLAGGGGASDRYGAWLFQTPKERPVSPLSQFDLGDCITQALYISHPAELLRVAQFAPGQDAVRLRLREPQRWLQYVESLQHEGRMGDARVALDTALCLIPDELRLRDLRNTMPTASD